jgi:ketosteroid isomerase-like protein
MSQEHVETVRRWFWAFENDEMVFRELTHPEIEWAPFEENHTVSHGLAGARRIRGEWLDAWGEYHLDIEEIVHGGDDIVVSGQLSARGKASGVEVDVRLHGHMKVRDGKVAYIFEHEDRAAALEAAGLRGQAAMTSPSLDPRARSPGRTA